MRTRVDSAVVRTDAVCEFEAPRFVDRVGAQQCREMAPLRRRRRRENPCTKRLRDLDRGHADPARAAVHENHISRPQPSDLDEGEPRRSEHDWTRRRFLRAQVRRSADENCASAP